MTRQERIEQQIRGERVDRIPLFGGWIEGVKVLSQLAGISTDVYLKDPVSGVVQANEALHVDGMVRFIVPQTMEEIRESSLEGEYTHCDVNTLLEDAESVPDSEEEVLSKKFDEKKTEKDLRARFDTYARQLNDIVHIPNFWEAPANFSLYAIYGYETFFLGIGLHPEAVERLWWESGVVCRARNRILARLIHEYDLPPMLFTGHDICDNRGPMCSPEFLRKSYWPHAKYSLQPLIDADIRLVHHCDGNIMPIVDDMIEAGFSGLQGFQYEVGVDPYELAKRRSLRGERLLFMAGLSCSRTLPFGSESDVKEEVDYIFDYTDGGQGLFLFTSNVITVETPPDNIRTAYRYAESINPVSRQRSNDSPRPWPGKGIVGGEG